MVDQFWIIPLWKWSQVKISMSNSDAARKNMQIRDFESRFQADSLLHVRHIASQWLRACRECFAPIRVLVNRRSALGDLNWKKFHANAKFASEFTALLRRRGDRLVWRDRHRREPCCERRPCVTGDTLNATANRPRKETAYKICERRRSRERRPPYSVSRE